MKDFELNVTHIDQTWQTCDYKFRVFVQKSSDYSNERLNYILKTLREWFGEAKYYWSDHGEMMFLCCLKK
jgi:hypothetical protein